MPDLDASGVLPFLLLGIRIIKEIYQILRQLRLLRFDGGKTISLHIHTHRHTTSFRVQGIGTDNASFHLMHPFTSARCTSAATLISFSRAAHGASRQDDAAMALIEGEEM